MSCAVKSGVLQQLDSRVRPVRWHAVLLQCKNKKQIIANNTN